jgi:Tat protein translocase TatB subunit
MFDLGIQELVVIFVVAMIVFGPKRLPELARNMGKGVNQLKKAMFDIRREIDQEVHGISDIDLDDLSLNSGGLKEALKDKAMEAVGLKDGVNSSGLGDPDTPLPSEETDENNGDEVETESSVELLTEHEPAAESEAEPAVEPAAEAEESDPYSSGLSSEERVTPEEDDEPVSGDTDGRN